jgi:23S rRNA A2030 N6-methylase RlmJ
MSATNLYDHHKKAGNEGDIVKHPALIAALDETLARTHQNPFRYADIFAGYASNPLLKGNEWSNGIGKIWGAHLFKRNRHVTLWAKWSGLKHEPRVGGTYPGSASFAWKLCRLRKRTVELSLWETSRRPCEDLKATFRCGHQVFNRAASPNELTIKRADFVFIDPPDKSHWASIRHLLRSLDEEKQSVLIWLPIGPNTTRKPPAEDGLSNRCRKEALEELELSVSKIRWKTGGRMIGCQLLYRVNAEAKKALRDAVGEIVTIAKWGSCPEHYDP